jgi:hypothetical protein
LVNLRRKEERGSVDRQKRDEAWLELIGLVDHRGRRPLKIYKAVAGAVAFISALVGPLFVFEPNLRPIGDAPTQLAKLSELRVDHDATFATYLTRIDDA